MAGNLVSLIDLIVNLIIVILFLNMLISFAPIEPWHPARRFIEQLAEPILRPFRGLIPPMGMFDLSPMVALIVIQIARQVLVTIVLSSFR